MDCRSTDTKERPRGLVSPWLPPLLLLLLLSVLSGCASSPETRDFEDLAARTAKEVEVGEAAFAKLAGRYGIVEDTEATAYLNRYVQSLALYAERQELPYRGAILDTEQVNAYALPGGYIFVTLGTLKRIDNPGALAGVIAHELGHIDKKHILEQVNVEVEYTFTETLARVIAGGRQIINTSMDQINRNIEERLFYEGYHAEDEYEADAYAVALLGSIGISPRQYRDFLATLDTGEKSGTELENLSATHPPLRERLQRIDTLLSGQTELPGLTPSQEFRAFQARIQAIDRKNEEETNL